MLICTLKQRIASPSRVNRPKRTSRSFMECWLCARTTHGLVTGGVLFPVDSPVVCVSAYFSTSWHFIDFPIVLFNWHVVLLLFLSLFHPFFSGAVFLFFFYFFLFISIRISMMPAWLSTNMPKTTNRQGRELL